MPVSPSPLTTYINNDITITTYRYVIKVDFWIYVNSNLLTAVPVLIKYQVPSFESIPVEKTL